MASDAFLDAIHGALLASVQPDGCIYYGQAAQHPNGQPWDYTVFARDACDVSRNGYSDSFVVAVVREDYVPEGTVEAVVAAMEGLDGVRVDGQSCEYAYDVKPGTNRTIEVARVRFVRARKRGR